MKEIIKKIICVFAIVAVMTGSFAGCSKKVDMEAENETEVNTQVETPAEKNEENTSDKNETDKAEDKTENDQSGKNETTGSSNVNKPTNDKNENSEKPSESKPELSISEIASKLIAVIPSDEHNMTELPKELYKDMYGIDASQYEDVLVFGSMMSVKANEIILIKVKNESDLSGAKKLLEERKAQVYKTWEQYLPDQFELVKQAKISTNGKYAVLIIAPYSDKINNTFMNL